MSSTTTVQETAQNVAALKLQSPSEEKNEPEYRYAHLLPDFSADRYPPLTSFDHVDPGHRALSHPNPQEFLEKATSIDEITPHLGTEIVGINLAELDSRGRDQLALEVCLLCCWCAIFVKTDSKRLPKEVLLSSEVNKILLIVDLTFTLNGDDILDGKCKESTMTSLISISISLHIHPTSGHPTGYPEIHLVYR